MNYFFKQDKELGIKVPVFNIPFYELTEKEQKKLLSEARKEIAKIPTRIKELDEQYLNLYQQLETKPEHFFDIMEELNHLSVQICALNVWFYQIEGYFIQQGMNV